MKSLKKNYIYNSMYQVLSIIIPFITTPYISRALGAAAIGEYSYGLSIAAYFAIFGSLGITVYAQISIAKNQDNEKEKSRLITELLFLRTTIMLISIIVYLIVAMFSHEHSSILLALIIYLLSQLNDISWILQGLEEFKKLAIRNIIIKIVSIISIFLFIKTSEDIYIYVFIIQGSVFVGNFLLWPSIIKYIDSKYLKTNSFKTNLFSHVKNSLVYFIPTIATTVYTVLDKSMLGWLTGSTLQNGYYEQAHKIEQILLVILTSFGTVTLPRISFLEQKNNISEIKRIIQKTIQMILFISIPMCLGLIAISENLIPVFLGNDFNESIKLIKVFSWLLIVVGLDNVIGRQCLMAVGKQKKFNIGVICGAILNLIMNLIMIPKFGAFGAAISSVCAEILILIIFCVYSKEYLQIDNSARKSIINFVFSGIAMYMIIRYLGVKIISSQLNILVIQIVLGIIIYLSILIIMKEKVVVEFAKILFNKLTAKINRKKIIK